MKIRICLLVLIVAVNLPRFECRRGGFGRGSGGKSYGSGSTRLVDFSLVLLKCLMKLLEFSIFSGKTSSSSSSSSSKWSFFGRGKPSSSGSSSTSNSGGSNILPLSTGSRNTNNQYTPSAPSLPAGQSGTGLLDLNITKIRFHSIINKFFIYFWTILLLKPYLFHPLFHSFPWLPILCCQHPVFPTIFWMTPLHLV